MDEDVELFCKYYSFIAKSKCLSQNGVVLLCHYIWQNTGENAPYPTSIKWLMENCHMGHTSVTQETKKLQDMGLVKVLNKRGHSWCSRIVETLPLEEIKQILKTQNIGAKAATRPIKVIEQKPPRGLVEAATRPSRSRHAAFGIDKFNSEVVETKRLANSGTDSLDHILDHSLDHIEETQNIVVNDGINNCQNNASDSANASKRKYAPMVVKSKLSSTKKSVDKHSQSTLINAAQEKKKVPHKDSLYLAKKLAEAISFPEENSKSLPERYLSVWPKSFDSIIKSDKIDKNECEQLIEWYMLNKNFDKYIPKIRTAKEFGEKVQKLRDAVIRVGDKINSNPFPWMDTPFDDDEIRFCSKLEEYLGHLPICITDKTSLCKKLSKWYSAVCVGLLPYVDTNLRDPDGTCFGICLAETWHSKFSICTLADTYGDYIRETSERLSRAGQASFEPPSGKLFRSYIQEITASWDLDITHPDIGLMGFRDTSS